jgi:hypothetical protein
MSSHIIRNSKRPLNPPKCTSVFPPLPRLPIIPPAGLLKLLPEERHQVTGHHLLQQLPTLPSPHLPMFLLLLIFSLRRRPWTFLHCSPPTISLTCTFSPACTRTQLLRRMVSRTIEQALKAIGRGVFVHCGCSLTCANDSHYPRYPAMSPKTGARLRSKILPLPLFVR